MNQTATHRQHSPQLASLSGLLAPMSGVPSGCMAGTGRVLSGVVYHSRPPWHPMECQSILAGRHSTSNRRDRLGSCRVLSRGVCRSFAAIRGYRDAGNCPDGATPLMKPVVARSGDIVDVSPRRSCG